MWRLVLPESHINIIVLFKVTSSGERTQYLWRQKLEGVTKLEMAAVSSGREAMDSQIELQSEIVDRLKALYPNVNEEETPLPRSWSTKDKYNYIGLSQNNLRVHYKGKNFHAFVYRFHRMGEWLTTFNLIMCCI